MNNPTTHQFTQYQRLYDWYNQMLFSGELPGCLLILSRKTARICGHFSQNRWQDSQGETTHEINLNPVYLVSAVQKDKIFHFLKTPSKISLYPLGVSN